MKTKLLDYFENPNYPLLGPNIWSLDKVWLFLPKTLINKILCLSLHGSAMLFVLSQYIELYVIKTDLDEVLNNLKISMLSTICVLKAGTFLMFNDRWRKIIDYITEADKYERDNRDKIKGQIIDGYTKYCRRISFSYWFLVFCTFVTVTQTPTLKYGTSAALRYNFRNGTQAFQHIFSSYMPFDKNSFPGLPATILWHFCICVYGAWVVAAFDANVVVMMVFFGGQLEIVRERCMHMLDDYDYTDTTEVQAYASICKLHEIHVELIKHSKLFNSVLSPVMGIYMMMCSLMICASLYQFTGDISAAQKIIVAEYVVFGVAQLFVFCWHSNDVLVRSEAVCLGPYESRWWDCSVRVRKGILLLAGQLRIVHVYTAGPFNNLTLSTFISILKGAYSYYTLLRK